MECSFKGGERSISKSCVWAYQRRRRHCRCVCRQHRLSQPSLRSLPRRGSCCKWTPAGRHRCQARHHHRHVKLLKRNLGRPLIVRVPELLCQLIEKTGRGMEAVRSILHAEFACSYVSS